MSSKSKTKSKLPDFNIRQIIKNGIRHLVLSANKFQGNIRVSLIDSMGNVSLEKKTNMLPHLKLQLKLPPAHGTYFVIIDSDRGEVVKRVRINDSFNNNPL